MIATTVLFLALFVPTATADDCEVNGLDEGAFDFGGSLTGSILSSTGCCGDATVEWKWENPFDFNIQMRMVLTETCDAAGSPTVPPFVTETIIPGGLILEGLTATGSHDLDPACNCSYSLQLQIYVWFGTVLGWRWIDYGEREADAVGNTWYDTRPMIWKCVEECG